MITEDYVSFETAKLLKEKGYCNMATMLYKENGDIVNYNVPLNNKGFSSTLGVFYEAPTLQMAMKWLNEVHHILVVPDYIYECTDYSWYYKIYRLGKNGKPERCEIKGVRYDKEKEDMVEVTVAYRDYDLSYESYATRAEAVEEGVVYVLKRLI